MSGKVTVKDHGLKALMARLKAESAVRMTVGVHEEEGSETYPGGQTVAEVATYNEFGERSFIRTWVDETEEKKRTDLGRAAQAIVKGGSAVSVLNGLAPNYVTELKARMAQTVPDDPETVEGKGSSEPLKDTGRLHSAIKGRVTSGTAKP